MLSITEISIRIAGRLLIDHGTAQIVPGARVGFVGRNGVGKSTLFAAIRGELPTETGTITVPPRWRVGSLAQEAPNGPESLIEVVLKADLEREGTLWLEDHLANYPRTVIVISHDRDLLDTSVDQILHLDRSKLTLYKGTYSSFEEQRATREMLDAKHMKRQLDERKRLQAFVDRFKAKASNCL